VGWQERRVRTKSLGNTTERTGRLDLQTEKARALTRRDPLTVPVGTSIRDAIRRMQDRKGEPVLVCDGGRLLGIVTERDVLMKVLGRDVDLDAPIDGVMTQTPGTLSPDASVREALEAMDRGGYRNLPLVDGGGSVVGLLRQQDVVEYVAESFPQEILNLPPRPHQRMDEAEGE
jgi:CBS domain-containing protein